MAKDRKKTLEEKRINKVSSEQNIPEEIVSEVINTLFSYMKSKMEKPNLTGKEIISKESFEKEVPILKIPGLGFLVPNYRKYESIKKNQKKQTK